MITILEATTGSNLRYRFFRYKIEPLAMDFTSFLSLHEKICNGITNPLSSKKYITAKLPSFNRICLAFGMKAIMKWCINTTMQNIPLSPSRYIIFCALLFYNTFYLPSTCVYRIRSICSYLIIYLCFRLLFSVNQICNQYSLQCEPIRVLNMLSL